MYNFWKQPDGSKFWVRNRRIPSVLEGYNGRVISDKYGRHWTVASMHVEQERPARHAIKYYMNRYWNKKRRPFLLRKNLVKLHQGVADSAIGDSVDNFHRYVGNPYWMRELASYV